jgi:hypothetical protein
LRPYAAARLRSLLAPPRAERPERLLAVGWEDAAADLASEITCAAAPEEAGDGPFDAVLWQARGELPDPASLARLHRLLAEDGRLVVCAAPANGQPAGAVGRGLVRRLSEAGFAVLQELVPEEVGARWGAAVLARRDDGAVRSEREGDAEAIRRLFRESFHVDRAAAHWRWKYHENPWGNRHTSLAVAPSGEFAAHYAGYPMPFWCGGRPLLALHMGDTMTAPRFRRVGRGVSSLLARTVRHFFALHRQGPFAFFYGFNTGGIQRFCRWFIGGSRVEAVGYRRRAPGSAAPRAGRGYRIERVRWVGRSWDRFFRRVAPHYGFLVRRDSEYVDWRYLRCPDGEPYVVLAAFRWRRLVGWGVFRRRGDRAVWGDALFDPRHARAAEPVLAAALAAPELAGAAGVEGWFSGRPAWWDEELGRLGFESLPEPNKLAFMILTDTDEEPPLDRLYYTMGDGDLF